jgi:Fur family transcriptional regulator, iron response regulator
MMKLNNGAMSTEEITTLLLEHEVRPTMQRIEIARVLLLKPQHLSADQVQVRVNQHAKMVSKATVYNTLNLFAEKGLIRQVIIAPGKVFYDSNTRNHHHFYHEDTGLLQDIEAGEMTIGNMPALPPDTVESGVDVVIRIRNLKKVPE